jgi:hypothetical protein
MINRVIVNAYKYFLCFDEIIIFLKHHSEKISTSRIKYLYLNVKNDFFIMTGHKFYLHVRLQIDICSGNVALPQQIIIQQHHKLKMEDSVTNCISVAALFLMFF